MHHTYIYHYLCIFIVCLSMFYGQEMRAVSTALKPSKRARLGQGAIRKHSSFFTNDRPRSKYDELILSFFDKVFLKSLREQGFIGVTT